MDDGSHPNGPGPEQRPARRATRRKSRVEQIALDHDLPPYQPKVGDIVVAYHLFRDPAEIKADFADARSRGIDPETYLATSRVPVAKFRPCMVMATKDNRAVLVPLSSRADQHGRHMALHEKDELRAAGLDDRKPAYAKVLEAAQYDFPHPMVLPVRGEDGEPTWVAGRATTEMRRQTTLEMARQKKHGRLKTLKDRSAATLPDALVSEMTRAIREAQEKRAPGRSCAQRQAIPTQEGAPSTPEERARAAAEALARRRGEHPEQTSSLKARAEELAHRRGTHPDQRVSQVADTSRSEQRE